MISVKTISDTALLPGCIRVAAQIDFGWWRKEKLWFDVPENYAPSAMDAGNAWLMALLPLAFDLGENLTIRTPVDPILLQNANELQRFWAKWFPARRPVQITVESPVGPAAAGGLKTGCFFTGGVDSFFSALHFDTAAGNGQKIDELIYVWGYDIPLSNRAAFDGKLQALGRMVEGLKKT